MAIQGTAENAYALTTLPKAKAALEATEADGTDDPYLIDLINGVSSWCERHCKRQFMFRTYAHTGLATTLELLNAQGSTVLFLPQRPVITVTSLKMTPDSDALTEGWDEDFTVQRGPGIITMLRGPFYVGPSIEITYDAGYPRDDDSVASALQAEYGWQERCQDLENSVVRAVAFLYKRRRVQSGGVSSASLEGGTMSFEAIPELKDVRQVWDSFAARRVR